MSWIDIHSVMVLHVSFLKHLMSFGKVQRELMNLKNTGDIIMIIELQKELKQNKGAIALFLID